MSIQVDDSIDVPSNKNNRSKYADTPVDETNMISFEDQSGQFMRNVNRIARRTDQESVDDGGLTNIVVEPNGNCEVKRLNNSKHNLITATDESLTEARASESKLLIDF